MISGKLQNLADAMIADAAIGCYMMPGRAAKIAEILLAIAQQVRELEDRPPPVVVQFPSRRARAVDRSLGGDVA